MKNLFKRIKAWYQKNCQYANFKFMIFYAAWLPYMLAVMLLTGHTSFDSWAIFALIVCIGLGFAKDWRIEANMPEYNDIVRDEIKHLFELLESEAKAVKRWQDRCISANRRRKRAELALKKCRTELRMESANRLGFEVQTDEYEKVLMDAYTALADIDNHPGGILPNVDVIAAARGRFMQYMKINYKDIATRQFRNQMKEDVFDCLFFGVEHAEPKEKYVGLFVNNPSDAIKENQDDK